MNQGFQENYQAAERAYAEGSYREAEQISLSLLKQLNESVEQDGQDASHSAWTSALALLLGHIELHGHQQPDQAKDWYERSLDDAQDPTLRDIAQEGLKQCNARTNVAATTNLLQDPFINTATAVSPSHQQPTAMPWLDASSEPVAEPKIIKQVSIEPVIEPDILEPVNDQDSPEQNIIEETIETTTSLESPEASEQHEEHSHSPAIETESEAQIKDEDARQWLKDSWIRISI